MPSSKTHVGVIFGGASPEHNVSIQSARTIINALNHKLNVSRFSVTPIYIDIEGRWWPFEIARRALQQGTALIDKELPSSLATSGFQIFPPGSDKVQVWFPVLHGPNGEDGTIQGLLKLVGQPFVGSGVLASAMGMDKIAMKSAFASAGLPQVPYLSIDAHNPPRKDLKIELAEQVDTQIGYPCFIKPANLGSSIGISKASNRQELFEGLDKALKLDSRIVVEKAVVAKELECAVLGGSSLKASAVGQICFDSDWYDYEAKYSEGSSQALIPAPITQAVTQRVQTLSLKACQAITANGLARVDFFYKEKTDELWINEINTLPGFTSKSMYPMLWAAAGVSLEQLVAKLVETAKE